MCGTVGLLYLVLLFLVADAESGAAENTYGAYLFLAVPYLIGAGLFGPGQGVFDYDALSGLRMELWAAGITSAQVLLLGLLSYLALSPSNGRHDANTDAEVT